MIRRARLIARRAMYRSARRDYKSAPAAYWNARHLRFDETLQGVGAIGLDVEQNERDYNEKWKQIQKVIETASQTPIKSVLDVGCGNGYFTQRIAQVTGARITAVDFSAAAIEQTRKRCAGLPVNYYESRADLIGSIITTKFDLVISVDVLFHIVEDEIWRSTISAMSERVQVGGTLIIQEHLVAKPEPRLADGAHVRWRSLDDYKASLGDPSDSFRYQLDGERATKDILLWRF